MKKLRTYDVLQLRIQKILKALTSSNQDHLIWLQHLSGKLTLLRKYLVLFIQSKVFENIFLFAVCINTIILSLYGYLTRSDQINMLDTINADLTYVFIVEMAIKIVGLGVMGYISSLMNLFDGTIVVVSIIDLIMSSITTNISSFRAIRILRIFRILRPLHYMKKIIHVFTEKFFSFIYICLLIILLIIIYTLIGNQIYAGNLNNSYTGIRQSFNTMYLSFLSVFQLVTTENWNDVETVTLYSGVGASLTVFYLLSIVILGNYVFLNLFLGVLLEGFSEKQQYIEEEENNQFDENIHMRKLKREKEQKEKENLENNKLDETVLRLDSEDWEDIIINDIRNSKIYNIYNGIECEESIWIFPKNSFIRALSAKIIFHQLFELLIMFLIFCNSIKLGLDTYVDTNSTTILANVSNNFDIFFNSCFTLEAVLKIIVFGFFFDSGSYLRSYWNILDFSIVIASLIDMSLSTINLPYLKVIFNLYIFIYIMYNSNYLII